MTRTIALFAACSILIGCATRSAPAEPGPVAQPAVKAPDPRLCAPLPAEPRLPPGASVPAAVTAQERAALEQFLGWSKAVLDWGRELYARGETAQAACPKE